MCKLNVKRKLFLTLCVLTIFSCHGQTISKGSRYVSFKYGSGKYSSFSYGQADLGWMYSDKLGLRLSLSLEKAELESTNLSVGRINLDHSFNVLNVKNRFYVNPILGAYVGYEAISSTRDPLSERNFVFGANAGLELDLVLFKSLSAKAEFLQYYMQNSSVSPWFYTGTIGISYSFN